MHTEKQVAGKRQSLGITLVLLSTVCLSTEAVAAKVAYRGGANVLTTLTLRYVLAGAVFWLVVLAARYSCRLNGRKMLAVTVLSLGAQTFTVLALFESFRYITAAMAILFLYFYPTVATILAFFFLNEPFNRSKVAALILTFFGCVVILAHPGQALDPKGVLFALAAAVSNAVFLVGSARLLADIKTPVYNAWVATLVALAVGVTALYTGELNLHFNLEAVLAIIVLGIVTTVLAMAALLAGVRAIGASRAAIISTFEPVATAILGFLVLGEGLSTWQIAGGAAVLAGVFLQRKG